MRITLFLFPIFLICSYGKKHKTVSNPVVPASNPNGLSKFEGIWSTKPMDLEVDPSDPVKHPKRCEYKSLNIKIDETVPVRLIQKAFVYTDGANRFSTEDMVYVTEDRIAYTFVQITEHAGLPTVTGECGGPICPQGDARLGIAEVFDAQGKIGILEDDGFRADGSPIWGQLQLFVKDLQE